jgi:hypothetical protein
MKRKKFERQRDRALAHLRWWERALGLGFWRVEYNWHDSGSSAFERDDGNITIARAWAKWQYLHLCIDINTPALSSLDDEHLEETMVHEFCHALVNEMREDDPTLKHEERVVTQLANAFVWVRDLARDETERERGIWDCVREMLDNALEADGEGMRERVVKSIELLDGLKEPKEKQNDGT